MWIIESFGDVGSSFTNNFMLDTAPPRHQNSEQISAIGAHASNNWSVDNVRKLLEVVGREWRFVPGMMCSRMRGLDKKCI